MMIIVNFYSIKKQVLNYRLNTKSQNLKDNWLYNDKESFKT